MKYLMWVVDYCGNCVGFWGGGCYVLGGGFGCYWG